MSADAIRIRRARRAIYGPPATAIVGAVLIAAGAIGLVLAKHSTTHAPTAIDNSPAQARPATIPAKPIPLLVVGSDGGVYSLNNLRTPLNDPVTLSAPVVGAAAAYGGGVWYVTRDGEISAYKAHTIGTPKITDATGPVVGITAQGKGYRIATQRGNVFNFGVYGHGDVHNAHITNVAGIAAADRDGYWLALANGKVYSFGGAHKFPATKLSKGARVVGIAAAPDGRGYWLATNDGHVYGHGVRVRGDLSHGRNVHVIAISASGPDGYWLLTSDGVVHPYFAPFAFSPKGPRIVAMAPTG